MNCLRCGLKLEVDGSFCPKCVEIMEKDPVDIHARVILPKRKPVVNSRPVKVRSPEEIILQQKKTIRSLAYVMIVLVLLVAILTSVLFLLPREEASPIGQNYNTETTVPSSSGVN